MNVRNCKKCGKIFNYVSGPPICPQCKDALEEKFQEVRKYIQDNRHATIPEVSEACEVSTNQIQQWLRDERLELAEGSGITLFCEHWDVSAKNVRVPWRRDLAAALKNRKHRNHNRRRRIRKRIRRCAS